MARMHRGRRAGERGRAAASSLPAIERQVMCVTCKIPLNVAESPQADSEREYIRALIAEGKDEAQIKQALVAQYTSAVLGLPQTHGFDLAAYLVPAVAVLGWPRLLAFLLPSWRRRAAAAAPGGPHRAEPRGRGQARVDLARFD